MAPHPRLKLTPNLMALRLEVAGANHEILLRTGHFGAKILGNSHQKRSLARFEWENHRKSWHGFAKNNPPEWDNHGDFLTVGI